MKTIAKPLMLCLILILNACNEYQSPLDDSAKNKSKVASEYLHSIDDYQQLKLIQTDDRYGEWGGNTFVVRVYKDKRSKLLLADYQEFEGTHGTQPPPAGVDEIYSFKKMWYVQQPLLVQRAKIQLNVSDKILIEDAIIELVRSKIKSENLLESTGIINEIVFRDSSFLIQDFNSIEWSNFQKLKVSFLKK